MSTLIRITLAGVIATAGLAFTGATAAECNGEITVVTTDVATLYVDDRGIDSEGIWIYEESNDVEGLQSGGASLTLGEADDCDGTEGGTVSELPDTLIL